MPAKENGVANGSGPSTHRSDAPEKERSAFINFDPDDPEYIKELQRPAAIKEDLTEMERRKRVQEILESKSFCGELEKLIRHSGEKDDSDPDYIRTLQRLTELTLPHGQMPSAHLNLGTHPVVPIADLRGNNSYSAVEKNLRNKLASLYRLVDLFQWSQGIYNHITLRIGDTDEILINPFGLLYHEITASSLIKVDLEGNVLDPGSTKLGINQAGYVLHSAVHKARPDVKCVLHLHTSVVSAVSSMKCGLLPICQEAMIIGPVAYHDYQGIVNVEEERASIERDLGDKNVMILRNHGFVACGESVEDALHLAFHTVLACEAQVLILRSNGFLVCSEYIEEAVFYAKNLIAACEHQIRAARAGIENLVIPDEKAVERAYKTARQGGGGVNRSPGKDESGKTISWRIGELEYEAWMRVLDSAGYRTGHAYRQPLLRNKVAPLPTTTQSEVAVPPSASAMGTVDETDPEALTAHKIALLRKEQEKTRWLNSPNAYQKVEFLETGTDNPKMITKWVQDNALTGPQNGTPVKIASVHQFSSIGANPKEFKEKQRAIKENRRIGTTTAGPQSQILESVTYEDMARIKHDAEISGMGPTDHIVMIGTASKGIIDRQHQHNAQVYRQLYAPNPFASETDEDIQNYIKEVELKTPRSTSMIEDGMRGASPLTYEVDSPNAETVSLMQAAREHRAQVSREAMKSASIDEAGEDIAADTTQPTSAQSTTAVTTRNGYTVETTFSAFDDVPSTRLVPLHGHGELSARSELTSDNDGDLSKDGKKKKKKSLFGFAKKKNK
ncbi:hypothetical protein QR680_002039 [Steinernema hermaphroditum]|uniref:Class II aldolase/adducin N-terminal domain-containing protein n=1 Tax=Steinernema hermaphroditum TaxID=289476 RepID=A0AA39H2P3_9BILA|nr:hypothetical protein QR680_002039 [Steinernema hermaphroditum]